MVPDTQSGREDYVTVDVTLDVRLSGAISCSRSARHTLHRDVRVFLSHHGYTHYSGSPTGAEPFLDLNVSHSPGDGHSLWANSISVLLMLAMEHFRVTCTGICTVTSLLVLT